MNIIESAGGVIINSCGQVVIVKQRNVYVPWSLPKGHVDPGEDVLAAALREIEEETGLTSLSLLKKLPIYERTLNKPHHEDIERVKRFHYFLFSTTETVLTPKDPDNPEAIWVEKEEVVGFLTHEKDKDFFSSLLSQGVI